MRGFLNVDKPPGMTSFDVVRRVRRAAAIKRVGHAGTLDPAATGVLPLALGEATRLVDELVGAGKRYHAEVLLGRTTDTYDLDGEVTAERDASHVTREAVERALQAFVGEIMQTPPAYSAVKRGGVPAYRAARRGDPLALEPRPVVVYDLDILDVTPVDGRLARVVLDVQCGRGFYVRSLAHDLGEVLGTGGTLSALRRTQVGPFQAADATPLDTACAMLEAGATERLVHAPDVVLPGWPALILGAEQTARVRQGLEVSAPLAAGSSAARAGRTQQRQARAYGPSGDLVALLEQAAGAGLWHPYRVFQTATPSQ
ncbi:MAG: tRNA pseudouridine(55) synthase TruB [Dehalococcoidia bacterium]